MISGQGWQRGLDMFSPTLRQHLGIPFAKDIEPTSSATKWAQLEADADKTVLSRFHILCNPPSHTLLPENRTSYRLYRGIAPLDRPHDSLSEPRHRFQQALRSGSSSYVGGGLVR